MSVKSAGGRSAATTPAFQVTIGLVLLCSALCAQGIAPTPKSLQVLDTAADLASPTVCLDGPSSPQAEYALGVLKSALGPEAADAPATGAAFVLRIISSREDLSAAARLLGLKEPPADVWQEAFVLDVGVTDGARVILTAPPVGSIYGAYALTQLLSSSTFPATLPRMSVSDWPTMLTRGYTGCVRDTSAQSLERLDWFSRWRINACYYEIYGDQGQDAAPSEVADISEECARRGITLYGQISNWRTDLLLKRELCASNPEDLARIRRYATELLDRGCDGLILLFDDITQAAVEHSEQCEKCKAQFGNLAATQLELMRPMLEVGRARGIDKLIVCPTPYWDSWKDCYNGKLRGEQYYEVWRDADLMQGVQVYHCLVRPERIREVEQAGLRNYIYWYNGAYDYYHCTPSRKAVAGVWGGLTDLSFGWYCYEWDARLGVTPREDTFAAFRSLPDLTRHAWLCGGGAYPWALWGTYCWDPERYDRDQTEAQLVTAMFGGQALPHYTQWRKTVRQWLPHLLSPAMVSAPARRTELMRSFQQDAETAQRSAAEFEKLARPVAPMIAGVPGQMVKTGEALRDLAATTSEDQIKVTIDEATTAQVGEAVRRERVMQLGSFWGRYVLRYSQTREPDDTLHRSQWHFGSGLGMLGPSYRNWYDAGFIDVLLDGKSLDTCEPTFEATDGDGLAGTWVTDLGTVRLTFKVVAGALGVQGQIIDGRNKTLAVRLYAIPGAGRGDWPDMDKFVVTESGEFSHGTPVELADGEDWILLADRHYDVPAKQAEGPCAALFGSPVPKVACNNGEYVVETTATYPPGTSSFSLALWDFHGQPNAEALGQFRSGLEAFRKALESD